MQAESRLQTRIENPPGPPRARTARARGIRGIRSMHARGGGAYRGTRRTQVFVDGLRCGADGTTDAEWMGCSFHRATLLKLVEDAFRTARQIRATTQ